MGTPLKAMFARIGFGTSLAPVPSERDDAQIAVRASAVVAPQQSPSAPSAANQNRTSILDGVRGLDLIRILLAGVLCVVIFLSDRLTTSSTMATQLYPAVLLVLYGVRGRFWVGGFWLLSLVLIGAGSSLFVGGELRDSGSGRALSILMVSITAIALAKFSELENKLQRQALIDPLTGTFNRRSFMEFASKEEARTHRGGNNFAVLMLDIDHFKRVNDVHGHPAGDAVIKELADVATRTLRPSDVLARYGGEEFVISLPDTTQDQALMVAERLRQAVEATAVVSETGAIRFTISIGIAICSHATPVKDAIARADKALYAAKHKGRNRVEINLPRGASGAVAQTPAVGASGAERVMPKAILIVDDDEEIRELLAIWLRDSGYAVLTAGNAVDALGLIETEPSISLLLTDIVMPGELNGFDLGRKGEAMRPNLKSLYMSGYAAPASTREIDDHAGKVLQKPFRLNNLLESVASALSA